MKTTDLTPVHSRRAFLTRSGLAAGAAALAGQVGPVEESASTQQQAPAPAGKFRRLSEPVLTNPALDGMSVLWVTSAPATGWVEYGLTETLGQRATGENQGLMPYDERAFKVRLKNLRPATRYYYRVHAVPVDFRGPYDIRRLVKETSVSEIFSFTTPNRDAKEVHFTVWNDTHEVLETLRRLHEAHQKNLGDFLLWNGDQTNDISTEERMIGQFLAPAGQAFATKVPYYYVRGNHDVRGPGARRLPRFSDVPDNAYYYSFRQGPLAALVLDTGEDKPDDHPVYGGLNDFAGLRTRQAEWLAKEIEPPGVPQCPVPHVVLPHTPVVAERKFRLRRRPPQMARLAGEGARAAGHLGSHPQPRLASACRGTPLRPTRRRRTAAAGSHLHSRPRYCRSLCDHPLPAQRPGAGPV